MYNGIINIYKEAGFTSHDVVAKMRGILGQKKIGHTGTLDPLATGVLPVCLGSGTKLCDMLTDRDKEYVAEMILGISTDTQDITGEVARRMPVECGEEETREAIARFVGEYEQIPPMYSALKVNGKKLYELAREGRVVERAPRRVKIYEIEILDIKLPVVKMRVACSKGTYIRTLCADIGDRLGCGGAMQSLVRTKAGPFELGTALRLDELERLRDEGRIAEKLVAPDSLFADCPALHVKAEALRLLENGNCIGPERTREGEIHAPDRQVRMYGENGSFAGIYVYEEERKCYKPVRMFLER
ncbi:MAG: tRNA pseudouridine(55) synthase TruB [Clostridium sp.]|nr:tRNA pseudouridine(55) synthase TruB [Acetatifactor muris]MCM1527936.1 tRNA pseudouridine(55) synthase TruB [Bacteroides sp.]MCM1564130.1 tRNA pseudouridine(55) synthase TruB [Clostridium sp.]